MSKTQVINLTKAIDEKKAEEKAKRIIESACNTLIHELKTKPKAYENLALAIYAIAHYSSEIAKGGVPND